MGEVKETRTAKRMTYTLFNYSKFPPGGYSYREPALNWEVKPGSELAMSGIDRVAEALRMVRLQNPGSGLNPDFDACKEAIARYTCARINNDPAFCKSTTQTLTQTVTQTKTKRRCKSCGGGRRR